MTLTHFRRLGRSANRPHCQTCEFPSGSAKVVVVGGVDRSTGEEGVGVEAAEEEAREKMEEVGEGCQAVVAGYRKRMAEEVERHMRQATQVLV